MKPIGSIPYLWTAGRRVSSRVFEGSSPRRRGDARDSTANDGNIVEDDWGQGVVPGLDLVDGKIAKAVSTDREHGAARSDVRAAGGR